MCWSGYRSIGGGNKGINTNQKKKKLKNDDSDSPAQYRCADSGKLERNRPNQEHLGPAVKQNKFCILCLLENQVKKLEMGFSIRLSIWISP